MAEAATIDLRHGDCLAVLKTIPDSSVDAIATDPPYGLSDVSPAQIADVIAQWCSGDRSAAPSGRGFMGKSWDAFVPPPAVWDECLRVLKPGGHMAVFAGSRTQDLMGMSIRLAGFEIRDSLAWIYGSGMPKSHHIGKAIDKAAGAERAVVGTKRLGGNAAQSTAEKGGTYATNTDSVGVAAIDVPITAPATPEAERWEGFGTALKPAQEPIILARKPLDGTVAANVLTHGVGGLNIDACRVGDEKRVNPSGFIASGSGNYIGGTRDRHRPPTTVSGRFPANVLLDEHAAQEMDRQSGVRRSSGVYEGDGVSRSTEPHSTNFGGKDRPASMYADSGGASRFFHVFKYQAKAPKKERPVIYYNECECDQWQSQPKATTVSTSMGEQSWSTSTSGNNTTGQSQKATTSTTSTTTNLTIGSRTCSASAGSSTNASTQGASCATESGGSPAECAENSSLSVGTTGISAPKDGPSTADAGSATSPRWYTTSECESCGERRRRVQHCTVKPLALMEWLVALITPPGGTVLDPFAGSGTTLQAARDNGFNAIGIEAEADYIALIEERLTASDPTLV